MADTRLPYMMGRPLKNDAILVNGYICFVECARGRLSIKVEAPNDVPLPREMVILRENLRWNVSHEVWEADLSDDLEIPG